MENSTFLTIDEVIINKEPSNMALLNMGMNIEPSGIMASDYLTEYPKEDFPISGQKPAWQPAQRQYECIWESPINYWQNPLCDVVV